MCGPRISPSMHFPLMTQLAFHSFGEKLLGKHWGSFVSFFYALFSYYSSLFSMGISGA